MGRIKTLSLTSHLRVSVLMVNIWIVRMTVCNGRMRMLMRVWLIPIPRKVVSMPMMRVMHVGVCVRDGYMHVHMLMTLG
ncbi:hypothetical protein TAO_0084 [Candidatus Nitrosoglobus terrae]|uniref:Uncharacterized protein n=1 Tax=Candidatus Nitrosoglobus terrae TaxID=1630141 RepID=A0A1Q2SK07_9GAMM|nr:hypothetical protein TAO_0084 [Candidatus Nitrosoglobus terrae]